MAITTLVKELVEQYSGPFPHPEIMKEYEKLLPGSVERIIKMSEDEARHRHIMDSSLLKMESRDSLLGVLFAFILSLSFLGCGTAIIFLVHNVAATVAGGVFGVSGFAGTITSMIRYTRTSSNKSEDDST